MNHRTVIQWSIVAIIAILIVWSIANLATYAYIYHASPIVWTLGIAVGAANAVSVYAFVIAHSDEVRKPAGIGILLFGGASGALQTLLYLHEGAPYAAAIPFGWIGPVAEGVLSWLHAALSEEAQSTVQSATQSRKPKAQRKSTERTQPITQNNAMDEPIIALPSVVLEAWNMKQNRMTIPQIAGMQGCSERTVNNRLKQARAQLNGHSQHAEEAHT